MGQVLVLNRHYKAIQLTSWQRALGLVYLEHAKVVDDEYQTYDFEDWAELSEAIEDHPGGFVHTPAFKVAIPEVIVLTAFGQVPKVAVTFSRRNIYEHYGYRCCYCGVQLPPKELNLEHIIPRSRGGRTDWDNVVTSCIPCNLHKGNRTPNEAGMKLRVVPSKPKGTNFQHILLRSPIRIRTSWQRFLDKAYWENPLEQD